MRKFILAAAALGLSSLAFADADTDVADKTTQDAEIKAELSQDAESLGDAKAERPNCLRYTGSRIRSRSSDCIEVPGTVHERDKLIMTGERDTAQALRALDPSISVRR
jgi:hypothetical protein